MWTTVHVVIGRHRALEIEEELTKIGFLVRIILFASEGEDELYEITTPEFEAGDIREAMSELGII